MNNVLEVRATVAFMAILKYSKLIKRRRFIEKITILV